MARRALGPATSVLVGAVGESLTAADAALLVACSGGPDSLALAAAAVHVARRRRLPLSAAVVVHGLQPSSAEIAERARARLVELGIDDAAVHRVEMAKRSPSGPEGAAREARYAALTTAADRRGATVLLGHTLDDQAETVLLGLVRGSGPRSLAGMALRSGRFLRPLLSVRRSVTALACAELGLRPWQDPQNRDDAFARARVRSRVLPLLEAELGPGVAEALSRTAQLARDDSDLLDDLAAAAHPVADQLDCARLAGLPVALRRRVIRTWLRAQGAPEVTYRHVLQVEELVTRWHGQAGTDLPGLHVGRLDGRLVRTG